MIRFITTNGTIEFEDREATLELLKHEQTVAQEAKAIARLRSTVYRVSGQPDPDLPFGGLLTKRLQLSENRVRDLLTDGRLAYYCAAKKAYRVSEADVQAFEAKTKVRAA